MLRLLKIRGSSLTPVIHDGDFVLVSKIPFLFRPLHSGDIVAFHHPEYGTMIKEVASVDFERDEVVVLGTHPYSVDSRRFGPVPRSAILGKVIWHIHP